MDTIVPVLLVNVGTLEHLVGGVEFGTLLCGKVVLGVHSPLEQTRFFIIYIWVGGSLPVFFVSMDLLVICCIFGHYVCRRAGIPHHKFCDQTLYPNAQGRYF